MATPGFPNSGTSYTMTTMEEASNYSTATNYGAEVTAKGRYSLSIYPRHPEGPFWEGLSGELGTIRYLPPKYVLVKTHCGSRCVKCSPSGYMQTLENFAIACRNTTARIPQADHRTGFQYPVAWVKKAIHLIRDPFSNIVSRFHHERKNFVQKKNDEWLTKYPDNPKGFQQWCADNDKDSELDEFQTFEYDLLKAVQLAPCHGEVFKFVQWHNLAFALTEKFSIETKVLLYEDFEEHFDETIESLLRFMEFPQARAPRQFSAKGSYSDYYSHVDRRRIGLLVKKIATKETWKHLERYILDIDWGFCIAATSILPSIHIFYSLSIYLNSAVGAAFSNVNNFISLERAKSGHFAKHLEHIIFPRAMEMLLFEQLIICFDASTKRRFRC